MPEENVQDIESLFAQYRAVVHSDDLRQKVSLARQIVEQLPGDESWSATLGQLEESWKQQLMGEAKAAILSGELRQLVVCQKMLEETQWQVPVRPEVLSKISAAIAKLRNAVDEKRKEDEAREAARRKEEEERLAEQRRAEAEQEFRPLFGEIQQLYQGGLIANYGKLQLALTHCRDLLKRYPEFKPEAEQRQELAFVQAVKHLEDEIRRDAGSNELDQAFGAVKRLAYKEMPADLRQRYLGARNAAVTKEKKRRKAIVAIVSVVILVAAAVTWMVIARVQRLALAKHYATTRLLPLLSDPTRDASEVEAVFQEIKETHPELLALAPLEECNQQYAAKVRKQQETEAIFDQLKAELEEALQNEDDSEFSKHVAEKGNALSQMSLVPELAAQREKLLSWASQKEFMVLRNTVQEELENGEIPREFLRTVRARLEQLALPEELAQPRQQLVATIDDALLEANYLDKEKAVLARLADTEANYSYLQQMSYELEQQAVPAKCEARRSNFLAELRTKLCLFEVHQDRKYLEAVNELKATYNSFRDFSGAGILDKLDAWARQVDAGRRKIQAIIGASSEAKKQAAPFMLLVEQLYPSSDTPASSPSEPMPSGVSATAELPSDSAASNGQGSPIDIDRVRQMYFDTVFQSCMDTTVEYNREIAAKWSSAELPENREAWIPVNLFNLGLSKLPKANEFIDDLLHDKTFAELPDKAYKKLFSGSDYIVALMELWSEGYQLSPAMKQKILTAHPSYAEEWDKAQEVYDQQWAWIDNLEIVLNKGWESWGGDLEMLEREINVFLGRCPDWVILRKTALKFKETQLIPAMQRVKSSGKQCYLAMYQTLENYAVRESAKPRLWVINQFQVMPSRQKTELYFTKAGKEALKVSGRESVLVKGTAVVGEPSEGTWEERPLELNAKKRWKLSLDQWKGELEASVSNEYMGNILREPESWLLAAHQRWLVREVNSSSSKPLEEKVPLEALLVKLMTGYGHEAAYPRARLLQGVLEAMLAVPELKEDSATRDFPLEEKLRKLLASLRQALEEYGPGESWPMQAFTDPLRVELLQMRLAGMASELDAGIKAIDYIQAKFPAGLLYIAEDKKDKKKKVFRHQLMQSLPVAADGYCKVQCIYPSANAQELKMTELGTWSGKGARIENIKSSAMGDLPAVLFYTVGVAASRE